MTKDILRRRARSIGVSGALAAVLAVAAAGPAMADTSTVDTSQCVAPALTQALLAEGDTNWYTMAPGESFDDFAGTGWTLSGGASIETTQLADGTTGQVLDLPSGAQAVSPPMCVDLTYESARTEVRDVTGDEGVGLDVAYEGTASWASPTNVGTVNGQQSNWTLSDSVPLDPGATPGWQLIQFTFAAGGTSSEFQLYNFWVDPRMSD